MGNPILSAPHSLVVRIPRIVDDGHHLVRLRRHHVLVEAQRGVLLALERLVLVGEGPLELCVRCGHGAEVYGQDLFSGWGGGGRESG